jgi:hypothetical protein
MSPRIGIRCAYKAETVLIEIFDQAAKTSFFANIIRFACLKTWQLLKFCQQGVVGSDPVNTNTVTSTRGRSATAHGA